MSSFIRFLFLFICVSYLSIFNSVYSQDNTYPTPNRLFHVERSKNKNIVCYDANLDQDGNWNSSKPIKIYWVNREEEPGKTNNLNAIQKKLAYGYKLHSHDDQSCLITLNACPEKEMKIFKLGNAYVCTLNINGEPSQLKKVFVQAEKNNSLKVEYVELQGINLKTGEIVSEKIMK